MRTPASRILVVCALLSFGAEAFALDLSWVHNSGPIAVSLSTKPAFPLKVSANNRYLVDRDGAPFLMVGDSPQSLIGNLSEDEAAAYIANRERYGINALWINLLCNAGTGCRSDGATADGLVPFTVPADLSRPNPAYFRRADNMIRLADKRGMVVILDPIETVGWLATLRANGVAKAYGYGQYLGSRYRDVPNIIWMHGNDFRSWQDSDDRSLVQAVAQGIRDADLNHLHTVELNFLTSGSLDDPSWRPLIDLSAAYTYFPTYAQILTEYNRTDHKPVFLVEANYEFEHNAGTDGGTTQNLRRQEYWTMLSGATGQLYGARTWRFDKGWEKELDSRGVIELSYMRNLFVHRKWHDLVPDRTHTVTIDGYDWLSEHIAKLAAYLGSCRVSTFVQGLFSKFRGFTHFGSIATNTYAPTARTADGSLVIVYFPTNRPITIDMSKLAAPATARWYDPTNATYRPAARSPLINGGVRRFSPPGSNSAGDGDWVLLLETNPADQVQAARGRF
ncbi:glycoside hydrolase family 140 protein [Bradyrhizobium sp. C-145]|uniref:apiosidase-like domain-containing protein n=1 Tax=Bradyrhizobium sp. C-145 TaxID=574727 RepID=UPI00201B4C31|nr:DUF4038 domain-containing protein [Bradyrhizobium sp. C-145]UQR61053.1 glycoside hydrolase family 140 protein [Bradyrhizobium sp. C-145]